jgi:hypothetical protein
MTNNNNNNNNNNNSNNQGIYSTANDDNFVVEITHLYICKYCNEIIELYGIDEGKGKEEEEGVLLECLEHVRKVHNADMRTFGFSNLSKWFSDPIKQVKKMKNNKSIK